jgi:hypothetical protein
MTAGFPQSDAVIRGGNHSQPSVGRMKLAFRIGHESRRGLSGATGSGGGLHYGLGLS